MKGIQGKIYKLVLAFRQRKRIIKININQNWSIKYNKMFTVYTVKEQTIEELELKKVFWDKKKLLKQLKGTNAKEEVNTLKKELHQLECKIEEITVLNQEFRNKIDVLVYLAERYKKVVEDEKEKVIR